MMEAVLAFDRVSFGYKQGSRRVEVLRDASVSFAKGFFYTIVGPSGSGKTTSLALAGALDVPEKGRVLFANRDIRKIGLTRHRKRNVGLIFRTTTSSPTSRLWRTSPWPWRSPGHTGASAGGGR